MLAAAPFGAKDADNGATADPPPWPAKSTHARYFSPNLARFLTVDPVGGEVGSSQPWNRYSYVQNNPLGFFDPNGQETRTLVGGRTERNPVGHIALEINGTVYSAGSFYVNQGPGGDWGVSLGSYLAAQEGLRVTTILTLDVSPEQETELAGVLQARDPLTPVGLIQGSCVNVAERALESADILPNEPGPVTVGRGGALLQAGAPDSTTPGGLRQQIQNAGLITARQATGESPKVSWLTSLTNGLKDIFSRE